MWPLDELQVREEADGDEEVAGHHEESADIGADALAETRSERRWVWCCIWLPRADRNDDQLFGTWCEEQSVAGRTAI